MLEKKPIKIWDVNADNIVISKLIEKKLVLSIWLDILIKMEDH